MKPVEAVILVFFLVFALLIYLLPLAAGLYMERKDRRRRGEPDPEKAKYDERQRLIRLEAGTHALYAAGACLLVWFVLEAAGFLHWPERNLPLLGGSLLLPLLVWNGECILRDAYLGYNQKKNENSQVIMYLVLGVCWTAIGAVNLEVPSISLLPVVQLLMGGSWLVMGVLMLCARRRRKLAERELDAEDGEI